MAQVRWGLVGTGKIAQSHCGNIKSHEAATVLAAHDTHETRLGEFCKAQEVPRAYKTAAELFADKDVDAVYIAVPNKFHAPLAIEALQAGKHVLLDKPFAMNLAEAEAVVETAKASGKLFMLGMNQRYRADSQKIRSVIASGTIGDIYHAKAFWMRREGIPRLGTWFGSKELAGGGCMLDIGVHMLDLCLFLIDNWEPLSVFGQTYSMFGHRGLGEGGWGASDREDIQFDVDDFATALIKLRNGASVSLDVSWAAHMGDGSRNDVHVFGSKGGTQAYPAKIFCRNPLREDYEVIENVRGHIPLAHADRFHNFTEAILGNEEPLTTLEQSLVVQKILDGIYESCRTGKVVEL
jgi:predicted dehydrogenase